MPLGKRKRSARLVKIMKRRARRKLGVRKRASLNTTRMRFGRAPSTMTVRGGTILPQKLRTVLPYADLIQRTAGTTAVDKYVYRFNNLYDPDLTGTGYFPTGRDQLRNLYEKYTVFGVAYDITAINMSDTVPARVCVMGTGTDDTYNTFQEASSQPNASKPIILSTMDGGCPTGKMTGYLSVASCRGVPPGQVSADDLYTANFTAGPTNEAFLQILHSNLDGSSNTDVHFEVNLKFYMRVSELKTLTQTA